MRHPLTRPRRAGLLGPAVSPSEPPMSHVDRLFTTRACGEVLYFPITKCGCTFLKNLLWRIDHQADHGEPLRVHRDDSRFLRASAHGYAEADIRTKPAAFVILRNPVDRFLSLYFDKVAGSGQNRFIPLKKILVDHHGLIAEPATAMDHRRNCHILIRWIGHNLIGPSELRRDPHWRPQSERLDTIRALDLKMILLKDMEAVVRTLLEPFIPDIASLMQGVERNTTARPIARAEILDPDLAAAIAEVYPRDIALTRQVWDYWDRHRPTRADQIPRHSAIFGTG